MEKDETPSKGCPQEPLERSVGINRFEKRAMTGQGERSTEKKQPSRSKTIKRQNDRGRAFVDILENPGLRGRAFVDALASLGDSLGHGPSWGQLGANMSQHGPTWTNLGQHGSTWNQHGAHLGPTWRQLGTNWAQHESKVGANLGLI